MRCVICYAYDCLLMANNMRFADQRDVEAECEYVGPTPLNNADDLMRLLKLICNEGLSHDDTFCKKTT